MSVLSEWSDLTMYGFGDVSLPAYAVVTLLGASAVGMEAFALCLPSVYEACISSFVWLRSAHPPRVKRPYGYSMSSRMLGNVASFVKWTLRRPFHMMGAHDASVGTQVINILVLCCCPGKDHGWATER